MRELAEEVELEKRETTARLVDATRQRHEVAQLSARRNAERQAQQYEEHLAQQRKWLEKEKALSETADLKLKQQQETLRAAAKRQQEIKKALDEKLKEKRANFDLARQQLIERRQAEAVKREAKVKQELSQRHESVH